MWFQNDLWQGSCDDGIDRFIDRNLLLIGYAAWDGYIKFGRGLVVAEINATVNSLDRWEIEMMRYQLRFIPASGVINYLQNYQLDRETVLTFMESLNDYNPQDEIAIFLKDSSQMDLDLLQRLTISTAECHTQVLKRWSEFEPCFITTGENQSMMD